MSVETAPIFSDPDPFVLRFKVAPRIVLNIEHSVPIFEAALWSQLSLTNNMQVRAFGWAQQANLRTPLKQLSVEDSALLSKTLGEQEKQRKVYPLSATDERRLNGKRSIRTIDREVLVEVPDEEIAAAPSESPDVEQDEARQSHKVQAAIARIGAEMGFRVWIPKGDRQKVQDLLPEGVRAALLDVLPLNYDDTTLRTVEQIDIIWLKNRSMARAFELEHTTAIYSGLLRMADLLALQPNMNIRLHIVAPEEKREKVLREIKRPVFSLLESGPLYENCSYLSYGSIEEIGSIKHLSHMSDSIVAEYEEFAQDA
ncbi:hypothetical protein MAE02_67670 [Microvirga aerophila]|uniref:Uncharacterized protein n=2 Tax=Microvirga aerophila TaxID=670291 RepID=A0A512C4D0_9HYPH|nr:hypothetical protein MAE02_67670 [Microvirga aerophila]